MNKKIIIAIAAILMFVVVVIAGFFYLTVHKKSNLSFKDDLAKCVKLKGDIGYNITNKDMCLSNVLRKIGKNPAYLYICNDFDVDNFKIECRASLSGDINICGEMIPVGDYSKNYVVEACYYIYAQSQGFKQKDTCKKISNSRYRDTCYFQYFESTGDKSICKEMTDPLYLENCK
ncbi:MAG: hypothetical protein NT094_04710 [Candidatus Staskawiczbacteria bacterium]|nr:hypothetical protein [Candidatus Staskawiczbacteria bacterium]